MTFCLESEQDMDAIFQAASRYDRRSRPEQKPYRFLTFEECKQLTGHAKVIGSDGRVATVAITSNHASKRGTWVRVGWKFGMYEFGKEEISQQTPNSFFVCEVLQ